MCAALSPHEWALRWRHRCSGREVRTIADGFLARRQWQEHCLAALPQAHARSDHRPLILRIQAWEVLRRRVVARSTQTGGDRDMTAKHRGRPLGRSLACLGLPKSIKARPLVRHAAREPGMETEAAERETLRRAVGRWDGFARGSACGWPALDVAPALGASYLHRSK